MTGEDNLRTIAEVAVAFTGFASIVAVFQRRDSAEWAPQDVLRLWSIIAYGLAAVFFSLLPLGFGATDIGESTIWAAGSALLAAFLTGYTIYGVMRVRSYAAKDPSRHSGAWGYSFLVLSVAVILSQLLNSLGLVFSRSYSGYFVGLLWLLVAAAVTFARLLSLAFRSEA